MIGSISLGTGWRMRSKSLLQNSWLRGGRWGRGRGRGRGEGRGGGEGGGRSVRRG
jgi:hypothetical protein